MSLPAGKRILLAARAMIESNWFGGDLPMGKGTVCAGIAVVDSLRNVRGVVTPDELEAFVKKTFGMPCHELVVFNDHHNHQEVLALFDEAIAKL